MNINDRKILEHAGNISHELAIKAADKEYEKFNSKRIETSDSQITDLENKVKMFIEIKDND